MPTTRQGNNAIDRVDGAGHRLPGSRPENAFDDLREPCHCIDQTREASLTSTLLIRYMGTLSQLVPIPTPFLTGQFCYVAVEIAEVSAKFP
jgi:hypothetical protein